MKRLIARIEERIEMTEKGAGVFDGMVHKERVIRMMKELKEIYLEEYEANKHYIELGKATKWLLEECYYNLAFAESKQIDCTNGGLYITDSESIIDLYEGLKNDDLKRKDR